MTDHLNLYNQLLTMGAENVCEKQTCGEYKEQLQKLHDFVYVVESTPNPSDPTYSPMFIDCIIHKSLYTPELTEQLKKHNFCFNVLDYNKDSCTYYNLRDTKKRRLLFEMNGKWWFFNESPSPSLALSEAIQFRKNFFRQHFAYLPQKFRDLVDKKGFVQAVNDLTEDEHLFLDEFIQEMEEPSFLCGCVPKKKSGFLKRIDVPIWHEPPELEIYEQDGVDVYAINEAVLSGEFLYMVVNNYYDGVDRKLYTTLYDILQSIN